MNDGRPRLRCLSAEAERFREGVPLCLPSEEVPQKIFEIFACIVHFGAFWHHFGEGRRYSHPSIFRWGTITLVDRCLWWSAFAGCRSGSSLDTHPIYCTVCVSLYCVYFVFVCVCVFLCAASSGVINDDDDDDGDSRTFCMLNVLSVLSQHNTNNH